MGHKLLHQPEAQSLVGTGDKSDSQSHGDGWWNVYTSEEN